MLSRKISLYLTCVRIEILPFKSALDLLQIGMEIHEFPSCMKTVGRIDSRSLIGEEEKVWPKRMKLQLT